MKAELDFCEALTENIQGRVKKVPEHLSEPSELSDWLNGLVQSLSTLKKHLDNMENSNIRVNRRDILNSMLINNNEEVSLSRQQLDNLLASSIELPLKDCLLVDNKDTKKDLQ